MFEKLYASPWGRLLRRFVVVGVSATVPVFFARVGTNPFTLVDNVLALPVSEWEFLLKLFVAAGVLAGLDKWKREWPAIKSSIS